MSSKKKKPIPQYQPTPGDQRAIDLHNLIGTAEDGVVPIYLELGVALKGIKEERKCDWKGLLTHATETLGLNRSYIVRAWRIRKLHESNPEQVNGLTLYEGLQHEPRGSKTVTPLELTALLAGYEYQAAKHYEKATQHFERAVGSKERAEKVMERFLKGETPVKATTTKVEKTWGAAWEEIKTNRDLLLRRGELNDAWSNLSEAKRKLPSYKETKANPAGSLQRFRDIRSTCLTAVETKHLKAAAGYHDQNLKIVTAVQEQVNQAVDTSQSAVESDITKSDITESVTK